MSTTNNICPPTDKLVHFDDFLDSYWTLQTTGTWSRQGAGYEPEPEPEPFTEEQLAYLEAEFEELTREFEEETQSIWVPEEDIEAGIAALGAPSGSN